LIPNWLYFIAISYVFFITISNLFAATKAQNDIGFSILLPVRKRDIVKARFLSIIAIELIHTAVAVVFAVLNHYIYKGDNFFLEPNAAFFGFTFIMYAIFNSIFLPMFYKTGSKIGMPVVLGTAGAIIFAALVEVFAIMVPSAKTALDSGDNYVWKLIVLFGGILIFIVSNISAYRVSAKRFENLDL